MSVTCSGVTTLRQRRQMPPCFFTRHSLDSLYKLKINLPHPLILVSASGDVHACKKKSSRATVLLSLVSSPVNKEEQVNFNKLIVQK